MTDVAPSCPQCVWVDRFRPRPDEVERGHVLGCRKPGWEGYTSPTHMACGGVFFRRNPAVSAERTTP